MPTALGGRVAGRQCLVSLPRIQPIGPLPPFGARPTGCGWPPGDAAVRPLSVSSSGSKSLSLEARRPARVRMWPAWLWGPVRCVTPRRPHARGPGSVAASLETCPEPWTTGQSLGPYLRAPLLRAEPPQGGPPQTWPTPLTPQQTCALGGAAGPLLTLQGPAPGPTHLPGSLWSTQGAPLWKGRPGSGVRGQHVQDPTHQPGPRGRARGHRKCHSPCALASPPVFLPRAVPSIRAISSVHP